ncbi:unnamed protein product [Angiostrongylus costaricensis]|uniref:Nuclear pore complex protein Nup85 n=1 Tax=Angiostrongylus costaricensis TaxID=334426 RepID=A0A0R3PCX4_ANGCS|nr:unnamed protein product [Angiostrongylus costaricensis]
MSHTLATLKRLLSDYYNQLETLALGLKNDGLESIDPKSDEENTFSTYGTNNCFQRWEDVVNSIEKATIGTKQQLKVYSKELGRLAQPSLKMAEEFDEHLREVIRLISIASDYMLLLQVHIDSFKSLRDSQSNPRESDESKPNKALMANSAVEHLPTLPIPIFSGDIDEWDTFWEFFSSNVHSQPLPEIYKLNYLLCALKGEALESIKMFQITRENYQKVVDFLRKKYGNAEELIFRLTEKLENCSLRSTTMSDKRKQLEQLVTITERPNQKGKNLGTQRLVEQFLLKFPHDTQRKVLAKKQNVVANSHFRMQALLQFLEEVIPNEGMLVHYARREPSPTNNSNLARQNLEKGHAISVSGGITHRAASQNRKA